MTVPTNTPGTGMVERYTARISELEAEVRFLGELADVCTEPTLKEVCKDCRCGKRAAEHKGK